MQVRSLPRSTSELTRRSVRGMPSTYTKCPSINCSVFATVGADVQFLHRPPHPRSKLHLCDCKMRIACRHVASMLTGTISERFSSSGSLMTPESRLVLWVVIAALITDAWPVARYVPGDLGQAMWRKSLPLRLLRGQVADAPPTVRFRLLAHPVGVIL